MRTNNWWKDEVVYQIYPRSFQDTNNDGIGDLRGIINHLDYLQKLGVTMIWICPVYPSPMVDMGYDISDYQAIDPRFGTMADFDELMVKAKSRQMKIMMDLVVNHTSDQHSWFKSALSDPTSKYRDYYIFKKTTDGKAPNNWRSIFGGSTWSAVPGEPGTYYFHTFATQQPDLNWENPNLRQEIYRMINWWIDKGVSAFRLDAITHLKKDLDWSSIPADGVDGLVAVAKKGQGRPGLEVFLQELKAQTFEKHNIMTVGEAYGIPEEQFSNFIDPNGYFSTVFDFSYLNIEIQNVDEWYHGLTKWTTKDLKQKMFTGIKRFLNINGRGANVLENHDQQRALSKYISNPQFQTPVAAKALATMYYFLPGIPFIYQGQELGMKNFTRKSLDEFQDISSKNNYQMALNEGLDSKTALKLVNFKSRDNARVPMQWNDSEFGGFSQVQPWIKMGNHRAEIDVASEQTNPESVLNYYRKLATLRKKNNIHKIIIDGQFLELNVSNDIIAYQRQLNEQVLAVYVNLSENSQTIEVSKRQDIILKNCSSVIKQSQTLILPAYGAAVLM